MVTRRTRNATKMSRIDTLQVMTLKYEEDYEEDYSMELKDVATEKGSGAFICYNTTLITLNIISEYGKICNMSGNRGQLASENVSP